MLPAGKADNQILAVVRGLKESRPSEQVILVSKDINMRLKAAALNLEAEDYFNDKMIEDSDILYSGTKQLPANFWEAHGKNLRSLAARRLYLVRNYRTTCLFPSLSMNLFGTREKEHRSMARLRV